MDEIGAIAYLHAKAGREEEVEKFLKFVKSLIVKESGTTIFCAVKFGPERYAIFETFRNEEALNQHRTGKVMDLFFAKAKELFDPLPVADHFKVVAIKGQGDKRLTHTHSSLVSSPRVHPSH